MSYTHTTYESHGDGTGTITYWWTLPEPETYTPSGDVRQVLAEIEASLSNRVPDLPTYPAGAEEAVAVGGEHVAAGQVGVLSFPAGGDPAAVEHEWDREAWLRRVQRESR